MNKIDLQTGDILLFRGDDNDCWYDTVIENVTNSPYEHVAMVIKDPWFVCNIENNSKYYNKHKLYAIQSNSNIDDSRYNGVKIVPLDAILEGRKFIDVRKISNIKWNKNEKKKFETIFKKVINKNYDYNPCHWLMSGCYHLGCKCCKVKREEDYFWCSALVGYYYTKMGWLDKETDWTNLAPSDLSKIDPKEPIELTNPIKLYF